MRVLKWEVCVVLRVEGIVCVRVCACTNVTCVGVSVFARVCVHMCWVCVCMRVRVRAC